MTQERQAFFVLVQVLGISAVLGTALPAARGNVDELNNLPEGHWYEFPNSRLDGVDPENDPLSNPNFPDQAPWAGSEGVAAVLNDWCGGAYNYFADQLIAWCGGHHAYAGNEVYTFDVATGVWSRASEPYGSITKPDPRSADDWCIPDGSLNPDGSPCSNHTYDYIDYHFASNALISLGNSGGFPGPTIGAGSNNAHWFDFDDGRWYVGALRGPVGGGMTGSSSAYDVNRDVFWLLPSRDRPFAKYDPNLDQWTEYRRFNIDIDGVSAIDPVRDLFVTLDERDNNCDPNPACGRVVVHDLSDPDREGVEVTTVGHTELEKGGNSPGFMFDPNIRQFVAWDGDMGATTASVYVLKPPDGDWRTEDWIWSEIEPAPGNTVEPGRPNENGTYSKWQYMPAFNAYILVNRTNENVYAYKLSAGAGVPAPPRPPDPGNPGGGGGGAGAGAGENPSEEDPAGDGEDGSSGLASGIATLIFLAAVGCLSGRRRIAR